MRLLFATTLIPSPESTGGEVISHAILEALEQLGCDVRCIGFLRAGDEPGIGKAVVVDRRPIETAGAGIRAACWLMRSLLTGRPYTSAKFYSRRYARIVRRLVEREGIEAVVIDHTQMGWLLDHLPPSIKTIVIAHNAESELYARGALRARSSLKRILYRRESRRLRELEARIATRAHRVWVLSEADRKIAGANAKGRVAVLPVLPRWGDGDTHDVRAAFDVGLLATWSWQPNAEGLRWFLDNIHPRLPRGISIQIAGPGADWLSGRFPGVTYRGRVDDALTFLRSARVIAVPTPYGSGVETKMLAAIASGSAVVSTSAPVRGLGRLPPSVRIADDAEAFCRHIEEAVESFEHHAGSADAAAWCQGRRQDFLAVLSHEIDCIAASPERVSATPRSAVAELAEMGA